jgi:hypothetical protein
MSIVRLSWASVQGDPVFMRRVNGWLTIMWIVTDAIVERTSLRRSGPLPAPTSSR